MSSVIKSWEAMQVKPLRWLAINAIFANFSNGLMYITMTWILLSQKNSISALAILMICFWAPTVFLGPLCGVIADRYSRRLLLIISNTTRGLVLLLVALFLHRDMVPMEVYGLAIALSLFGNLYGPASFAYILEIVPKPQMFNANAIMATAYEIGNIVGMGSAGLLIALHSARVPMALSGLLFMAATLCLLKIHRHHTTPPTPRVHRDVLKELYAGLTYLVDQKDLRILYTAQLLLMVNFLTAPILLAPFAKNLLHASPQEFGLLQICLSIGIVLGGLVSPFLVELWELKNIVLIKVCAITLLFILFSLTTHLVVANIIYFLLGLTLAAWTLIITKAQLHTDLNYLARSQAAFNSLAAVVILLIYLLLNLGGDHISLRALYGMEAIFSLGAFYLLWRYRTVLM
ncbi:MAG: MFS transporter [Gammaproteobacteria bacterium]